MNGDRMVGILVLSLVMDYLFRSVLFRLCGYNDMPNRPPVLRLPSLLPIRLPKQHIQLLS